MNVEMAYAAHTSVVTSFNGSALAFAANLRRPPVAFQGVVREPILLRQLMGALHGVITSDYRQSETAAWLLDPVITVHPDEVFFEAFSTDESAYCRLSAPISAFEVDQPPTYGTTNIDFTWALRDTLQNLRSSRRTTFTIGAGGFGVATKVGGESKAHFERKVDLPNTWLKGFLQVQGALTMNAFTFDVRPADLLTVLAYMDENRKMGKSNGLRYDFKPGEPVGMYIEPADKRFVLKGKDYNGYPRIVRLWGRRRLALLQTVLPFADQVTVGVIGRGLPHFYICHCGPYRFMLLLSGWTRSDWAGGGAFDLLAPRRQVDPEMTAAVYNTLAQHFAADEETIAVHALVPEGEARPILFELCRAGRVIYDPVSRQYRLRELFAEPLDMTTLFAPDPRVAKAQALETEGHVTLITAGPSEVRRNETRATATVQDGDKLYNVVVATDPEGQIRFGQCQCRFFVDNIMSRGPCEHILAARLALGAATQRQQESA